MKSFIIICEVLLGIDHSRILSDGCSKIMVGGENCSQIVRFLHVIRHALWLQFGFWRQLPFTYTLLGLVQLVPTDDESNFQRRIVLENLFFLSFAQKYVLFVYPLCWTKVRPATARRAVRRKRRVT